MKRPSIKAISIVLLFSIQLLVPAQIDAQEGRPYTLEQIEGLLEARLSSAVILNMVRPDCLAFRIDEESERRLAAAGATGEFMEGLRGVCYEGPEEAPAEAALPGPQLPYNPGSTALRSLAIPGLGQFQTGRPVMGAAFLAAWAGAIGFGVMSQEVTVECLAQTTGSCPSGQVRAELTERPMLPVALGAAVVVAVISAFEARSGANRANARVAGFGGGEPGSGPVLEFLPAPAQAVSGRRESSHHLVLLQLRHR